MEINTNESEKKKRKKREKRQITYLDKYEALQKDYISIQDLMILNETSYSASRQEMLILVDEIKNYNLLNPTKKYRILECPYKIPKSYIIEKYKIDEAYIFKKTKEELQLKNMMKGE